MFGSLSGSKLGIWVAHGEGKFSFPYEEKEYHIALKYNYEGYPPIRTVRLGRLPVSALTTDAIWQ